MAWNAATAATHPKAPAVVTRALKPASFPSAMTKLAAPAGNQKLAMKTAWFETLRRPSIQDGHGQQGLGRGYTQA
ncbi:hypothetical protein CDEST_11785 [Colletotrichum destructivum]|uniref:Uncharacterized protein n=1 Tax=Colletotrichum destructivum TaxID=34406 RepID=A0AAX4IUA7_9PEZI|nr:hypothetical protein CDEST_11785 [Colletotrichum destructivum]